MCILRRAETHQLMFTTVTSCFSLVVWKPSSKGLNVYLHSDSSITAVVSSVLWLAGQSHLHSFLSLLCLCFFFFNKQQQQHQTISLIESSSKASPPLFCQSTVVLYLVNTLIPTAPASCTIATEDFSILSCCSSSVGQCHNISIQSPGVYHGC